MSRRYEFVNVVDPFLKSFADFSDGPWGRARSRLKNRHKKEEMLHFWSISTFFLPSFDYSSVIV